MKKIIGKMMRKYLGLWLVLTLLTPFLYAQELGESVVSTKHNKHLTLGEIAEIQPGLGSVMLEMAHRFHIVYYAAKNENWELAKYEIKELLEAQEIAEVTRPQYAKDLMKFEHGVMRTLKEAVEGKNFQEFEKSYTKTTNACNACHVKYGHPYIQYELPQEAPKYLRFKL